MISNRVTWSYKYITHLLCMHTFSNRIKFYKITYLPDKAIDFKKHIWKRG